MRGLRTKGVGFRVGAFLAQGAGFRVSGFFYERLSGLGLTGCRAWGLLSLGLGLRISSPWGLD